MTRGIFLYLWIASTIVFFLASSYSEFPNQIHWAYNLAVFALALLLVQNHQLISSGVGELVLVVLAYYLAFYLVSFWEVFPGTTVQFGRLELINVAIAINGFFIGRNYREDVTITAHSRLALIIVLITATQIFLDPDRSRYGYGIQLMLCLPAAMLLRNYLLVAIGIVTMLASQHKAPLVGAVVAIATVVLVSSNGRSKRQSLSRAPGALAIKTGRSVFLSAAILLSSVLVAAVLAAVYSTQIGSTIARFLPEDSLSVLGFVVEGEGSDPTRDYVSAATLLLLPEYFVRGMGYMNFYVWSGEDTGIYYLNALGREITGINLHNSYATWLLEGGLLVTGVVAFLAYRAAAKLARLLSYGPARAIGILLLSWYAAELLLGAFHQLHVTMQFWTTIGVIFGYHRQFFHRHAVFGEPTRAS